MNFDDEYWMAMAIEMANKAEECGEVPVGAILVKDGELVAKGYNYCINAHDPSAHAEMQCIRSAGQRIKNYRLNDTTLYVTLEPCAMCCGAIIHARIKRVVYGATDLKTGAMGSVMDLTQSLVTNHHIEVTKNILNEDCAKVLSDFFKRRRAEKKAQKTIKHDHG